MVMESDQLSQRLDWMDNERRKDHAALTVLEERVKSFEDGLPKVTQQIQELNSEVSRIATQLTRFDELQTAIAQIRVDQARALDALEKQQQESNREQDRLRRGDMEALNRAIGDLRKILDTLPEMRRNIQARQEEEYRLARLIEELDKKLREMQRYDEEYKRAQKLYEEAQRQDNKRMTDLQGEVAALRKRADEQRGKVDLNAEGVRKLDLRLGDIQATDLERRQIINSFIEKQTVAQVERERAWKEMQTRFDEIAGQASDLDAQMQSIEATHRAVKRAQEAFDDITQRFDRRINEISEMQRLVEERFRQEWVAFRADDQKRWTNYSLTQEEQGREVGRRIDKIGERLQILEELSQVLRDQSRLALDDTQKRLQDLLTQVSSWLEDYNRLFGQRS
jgi:chromosome segregation ATPase